MVLTFTVILLGLLLLIPPLKKNSFYMVHAGLVIQVLSESQAQEINNLLAELETLL